MVVIGWGCVSYRVVVGGCYYKVGVDGWVL